jgi:hypothetical protein
MNGTGDQEVILSEISQSVPQRQVYCFLSFVETRGKQNKNKNKVMKVKWGL